MRDRSTEILDAAVSLEEFQRMPDEHEYRLELVRGRVIREPGPAAAHGWLSGMLTMAIGVHASGHGLGIAVTNTGFLLHVDPPTVRVPDVAFIARMNLPEGGLPLKGFWTVAPDLSVEVLSPSNTAAEIQEKVLEYLESGTRLVWIVDPATRCVTVYRSRVDIRLLMEGDTLEGHDVLPGFVLQLAELFEPLERP